MSFEPLKAVLFGILERVKGTKELAEEEIVGELFMRLTNDSTNHLIGFGDYLQNDCYIPPKIIVNVAQNLLDNPEMAQFLRIKIINFWLIFKIYEAMDILKMVGQNKEKRIRVREIFMKYECCGSSLTNLIKTCCAAIGLGVEEINDMIDDMVDSVKENRQAIIDQLFIKADNPDKSSEEKLKDLISDFIKLPKGSFERLLLHVTIMAHVQKYPEGKTQLDETEVNFLPLQRNIIQELESLFLSENKSTPISEESFNKILSKLNSKDDLYDELCAFRAKLFTINVPEL